MLEAYCSWCYQKSEHGLLKKNILGRNKYLCFNCDNHTMQCRYCKSMAKASTQSKPIFDDRSTLKKMKSSWDSELCAEHDGSIASFRKLDCNLSDITQYEKIFVRDSANLAKAGKYAGATALVAGGVAGIVATGGGAGAIAAALGEMGVLGTTATTGTAISSLSGAALTNASLAAVGSSMAAVGGSMAVGTAIVTASGAALGGTLGGVLANKYYGQDKSFAIRELVKSKSENSVKTIFINGFTQEKETSFKDWLVSQERTLNSDGLYGVNWASKTNYSLGVAFAEGVTSKLAINSLLKIAGKGGKKAAAKLSPIAWVKTATDLAGNPWHISMVRAAQTGILLADTISRTKGQKFNLVGHSLGCRVIYYLLEALSTKDDVFINDVIFLGGAVGRKDTEGWGKAISATNGHIYNCYSNQDQVLNKVYRTANAHLSDPIGVRPIDTTHDRLTNMDCSDFVDSHMNWKKHYFKILSMLYSEKFITPTKCPV